MHNTGSGHTPAPPPRPHLGRSPRFPPASLTNQHNIPPFQHVLRFTPSRPNVHANSTFDHAKAMDPRDEFTYEEGTYYCKVCSLARGTKDWRRHIRTNVHKQNVEQHQAMSRARSPIPIAAAPAPRAQEDTYAHPDHLGALECTDLIEQTPVSAPGVDGLIAGLTASHAQKRLEANTNQAQLVQDPRSSLEKDLLLIAAHKGNHIPDDERPIVRTDKRSNKVNMSAWFPFKSKLDLVASLLIGHTRSMLSRSLYKRISALWEVCGLKLLRWAAVRESRKRIRDLLGNKVQSYVSVFDTPCYALSSQKIISQELANPLVARHMEYYPESTDGLIITKFSQSGKWLTGMSQDHRPQMCRFKDKDFYIFEPVELQSKQLVIPIFFFTQAGVLHARCWDVARDAVKEKMKQLEAEKSTSMCSPILGLKDFDGVHNTPVLVQIWGRCHTILRGVINQGTFEWPAKLPDQRSAAGHSVNMQSTFTNGLQIGNDGQATL
ncbi:hypothetical protein PtA15_2A167 [Puccinia triticina]|uniref:U1-type domain-containing protein n=1 Tax=Puccinia triticina TaxID=208348 RepID=A0ABY7C9M6_9BASI|nr:uncharacterized protein PtA15_2A167 [Puccinia triticina]WAQ81854.1 hypothetical protein PtA15_2A167 [Puccinia triticina]